MYIYSDTASILEAANTHPDSALRDLLTSRIDSLQGYDCDLAELVHVFVVEPGDTLATLEAARGWPFADWELIQDHGGWIECVFIISDEGFGHVVLIPNSPAIDPALLDLCRESASDPGG